LILKVNTVSRDARQWIRRIVSTLTIVNEMRRHKLGSVEEDKVLATKRRRMV
jgi:hypothetical protein